MNSGPRQRPSAVSPILSLQGVSRMRNGSGADLLAPIGILVASPHMNPIRSKYTEALTMF